MFVSWDWETIDIVLSSFQGSDTTGNKVSVYPTMDSTAPLEKLNMIFDSHLGILYTRELDYTCAKSNNAYC